MSALQYARPTRKNLLVQVGLEKLASDARADEVIVVTQTYEHSDRIDSYQRVARMAAKIKLAQCDAHAG